jgi:signal transduction histidine kinase
MRRIEVAVHDSGPGIAPRDAARIFEPFYSTKPEGMGIGLAICRSIVESHGGRLWFDAGHGAGATFRFQLPAAGETA